MCKSGGWRSCSTAETRSASFSSSLTRSYNCQFLLLFTTRFFLSSITNHFVQLVSYHFRLLVYPLLLLLCPSPSDWLLACHPFNVLYRVPPCEMLNTWDALLSDAVLPLSTLLNMLNSSATITTMVLFSPNLVRLR